MASGGDWIVQLKAQINTSDVSAEIKRLANEKIQLNANLDLTNFSNSMNSMREMIKSVQTEMNEIFKETDFAQSPGYEKTINQWATEYVKSWQTATQQVQNEIDRTLNSLNNFSMKNAGFDSFKMDIDGVKVSVEDLKTQLGDMRVSGDIAGLDNVKSQIETLKSSFTEVEKTIQNIDNFSIKNVGFENFSSEIDGAKVSVQDLKSQLEHMQISGDVSGLNNIKSQVEQLKSQFTSLSSEATQSLKSLDNFSISHAGFESFKTEINGIEVSVEDLKTKLSDIKVSGDFSGLSEIKGQIETLKTEFETISKIEIQMNTGGYEGQIQSVIAKTQQWTDANGQARISTEQLSADLEQLNAAWQAYDNNKSAENTQRLVQAQQQLTQELAKTKNEITEYNAAWAKTSQVESLLQRITEFADKNSAAMRQFGTEINSMMAELSSGVQMPVSRLKELETEFKQVGNAAREAGQLGQSFGDKIQSAMSKFSYWTSATMIVMQSINAIRSAITTVVDLDTALVDLQKTTTMTTDQLNDFYYAANDTAKQMGVTTEEIISQAAAWSRLGYSSNDAATQMAALSSQFASISPGMDTETAQEGLVSTMKAFGIETDDVLDGIMSKINIVGNTAATTNADIVEMLERSSSAMSEANNSLEETIALETAAFEITQNSANVGTAYKTNIMSLHTEMCA